MSERGLDESYRLIVQVMSQEFRDDRGYIQRDALARLEVAVGQDRAWRIYQRAVEDSVKPNYISKFPESVSAEDAERFRSEFHRKHKA